MEKLSLGDSKIQSYLGIDKREGLVAIAKRLLQSKVFPSSRSTLFNVMRRRQTQRHDCFLAEIIPGGR